MIANHPSWESTSRLGSVRDASLEHDSFQPSPEIDKHQSPSVVEAIAARMKRSPWAIVIASVSLGVLAGCLVKRR